jgi:ABC-type Fe3+-hydroxamate transport system substrate-binding protein
MALMEAFRGHDPDVAIVFLTPNGDVDMAVKATKAGADNCLSKPVEIEAIRSRPGWDRISAVRTGRIYELDGGSILAPGPSVMAGLRQVHEIIQDYLT